jgi:hypothetical protein
MLPTMASGNPKVMLRVSAEQRELLVAAAGGRPLASWVREVALVAAALVVEGGVPDAAAGGGRLARAREVEAEVRARMPVVDRAEVFRRATGNR